MRLPKLADVFAGTKSLDITTTAVERYKTLQLKDKAAAATVNRELAALKWMFRLGMRQGMLDLAAFSKALQAWTQNSLISGHKSNHVITMF